MAVRTLAACVCALALAAPGTALPWSFKHDPTQPEKRPGPPTLRVTPARVHPGGIVRVQGSGCRRGQRVSVLSAAFAGSRPGSLGVVRTRATRNGGFAVAARIPARTRAGRYAVAVRCGGTDIGVLAWFRVVAP